MLVLIEALDYPDKRLPLLMLTGMKVAGDLAGQESNVYRPEVPAEPEAEFRARWSAFDDSHDEWLRQNERRTLDVVAGASSRASAGDRSELELLRDVHRATQVEVHKGLMGPPMTEKQLRDAYTVNGRLTCRVIPRFGVVQGTTQKRCRDWSQHRALSHTHSLSPSHSLALSHALLFSHINSPLGHVQNCRVRQVAERRMHPDALAVGTPFPCRYSLPYVVDAPVAHAQADALLEQNSLVIYRTHRVC